MSFEIIDNIFQILVMFTAMCMAVVTAFRSRRKEFLMLAGGYGCFMMGTLYYVLCLIITGKVPQIFYVAEISWEAAYLFFLSVSLSRRKLPSRNPGIFTIRTYRPFYSLYQSRSEIIFFSRFKISKAFYDIIQMYAPPYTPQ